MGYPELAFFADQHEDREYEALLEPAYQILVEDLFVLDLGCLDRELDQLQAEIRRRRRMRHCGGYTCEEETQRDSKTDGDFKDSHTVLEEPRLRDGLSVDPENRSEWQR